MAPIVGDDGGPESSGLFAYLNTNKCSIELDVTTPDGNEMLHKIIDIAEAVVDDHDPAWAEAVGVSETQAQRRHPAVQFCSITPYGHGAPPEFHNAKSLNVFHSSGWGYHTPSHPDPAKPPLKGPGRFLADYEAGLDAALCVASSLFWHLHTGQGQFIDISAQAVLVSRADSILGRFITGEIAPHNDRNDYDQQGRLPVHDQPRPLGRPQKAAGPTGVARHIRRRLARILSHCGEGRHLSTRIRRLGPWPTQRRRRRSGPADGSAAGTRQ
jgi:crotonobetainyl-CoA:carnitine CoA-transferase CaiB-like acyl-CoA transferase